MHKFTLYYSSRRLILGPSDQLETLQCPNTEVGQSLTIISHNTLHKLNMFVTTGGNLKVVLWVVIHQYIMKRRVMIIYIYIYIYAI